MLRDQTSVELRHLRYFLAVIEELHFGRAADRLQMAQPPLSRAIRKLEDGLGVQLLVRSSRSVTPTRAGVVFAEEARKVLADVDRAVGEARRVGGASGALRIACVPYIPAARLQQFLRALHERDEQLTTEVTHIYALEQVRRLRARELDLGIFADLSKYPDLESEPLFPGDPVVWFGAESHPLAAQDSVGPADLRHETLIVFPRELNPAFFDRWMTQLDESGFRFAEILESTSLNPRDAMLLAARGRGIALAPVSFRDEGAADVVGVTMRPLDRELAMPDTRIAWVDATANGTGRRLELAREVARELYGSARVAQAPQTV